MPELRLDLHIHSRWSPDGRMSLEEIAGRAIAAGLDGVAVCDHDCVLPEEEIRAVREVHPGLVLIPGIEISTDQGHLLGWPVTDPIGARVFTEASAAIRAQGGMAVLAHPFEHPRDPASIVPLIPYLDGIEVWNGRADRKDHHANAKARAFAEAHALRRFAGSDAHVPREIGNGVTTVRAGDRTVEAVIAALRTAGTETGGRRGRAVDVAASQFVRRRKQGAGTLSYCKWALFAVKCVVDDLRGLSAPREDP